VPSYAEVVSRVAPAVVTIHSARRVRAPRQFPFFSDPFLREFFGGRSSQAPPRGEVRGLGSGVIVAADGVCLTNHHVIDGAEQITVELTDRRTFEAELVGSDPPSDLAVLKIGATDLPTLTLGDSERVRVGDVALAIGNPLGVGQTVTAGIISAKGRYTGLSDGSFEDFLQTDAPINEGNSGGALVNGVGELVGINSQILSTSGGNIGIGFAIPSNMARNVMQQLIENRRVRRGMLGVVVEPITPEIAKRTNRSDVRGVLVRDVVSGGPADKAGIRPGDVVLAINGTPIEDANSLRIQVANSQPGSQGTLTVWRDGREQQIRVTFGELEMPERRT
jgi:Do/DeqQ family serine protease